MATLFGVIGVNKDCAACQQVFRRRKINSTRYQLRKKGVAKSEWPEFAEEKLPSNRSCVVCRQRLEYYRVGIQERRAKKKKEADTVI